MAIFLIVVIASNFKCLKFWSGAGIRENILKSPSVRPFLPIIITFYCLIWMWFVENTLLRRFLPMSNSVHRRIRQIWAACICLRPRWPAMQEHQNILQYASLLWGVLEDKNILRMWWENTSNVSRARIFFTSTEERGILTHAATSLGLRSLPEPLWTKIFVAKVVSPSRISTSNQHTNPNSYVFWNLNLIKFIHTCVNNWNLSCG